MRLLLDESVTRRLRPYLPTHAVRTVAEMGWNGFQNGKLLALACREFDALVTVDKNLQYQQNLNLLPLTVIVLDVRSNELSYLLPLLPKLEEALVAAPLRTLIRVTA